MLDRLPESLAMRGVGLPELGSAYLVFLGTLMASVILFLCSRSWLVVTPNRAAKHYGLYVATILVSVIVATILENELVPRSSVTLQYVMLPQLFVLTLIHLWIYYVQEPRLIAVGASANLGSCAMIGLVALLSDQSHVSYWLMAGLLTGLVAYLAYSSISTKRGFLTAQSIYASSKEHKDRRLAPQRPWLGLPQWVALACASIVLAAVNAALRGYGIADIPAITVLGESTLLLAITMLICALPAVTYWFAHKHWMPELTRFVWLVWLVVGFAFTYGNFLSHLQQA
jgi:hypothetical protein